MFTISKQFEFSAAHHLNGLEEGHPCGRNHGHNYIIEVFLRSEKLDDTGFVLDYGKLKPIKEFIDDFFDHKDLNGVVPGQPSAERIAQFIYERFKPMFKQMCKVSVKETRKTLAIYEPSEYVA